jgi:pyrroline-5-carboxylate reductase
MMSKSPLSLDELITQVSSPGGTTVKGLQALDRCGFDQAVRCCIDDCVERAYELGK